MNRSLLLSALLWIVAATAWAQHAGTIDDPIPMTEGYNSFANEEKNEEVVFSYTSTNGTKLTLVYRNGLNLALYPSPDATRWMLGATTSFDTDSGRYSREVNPVEAGHTVYLRVKQTGGNAVSFTAIMEDCPTAGKGVTADDEPLSIKPGDGFFVGNGYDRVSLYGYTYITLTATETGLLLFKTSSSSTYVRNAGDQRDTGFRYSETLDAYFHAMHVTAGETYNLVFRASITPYITVEMSDLPAASYENPMALTENGDYTVPAAAGYYYYTFNPTTDGVLNIWSDEELPGGQLKLCDSFKLLNNVVYRRSTVGYFDIVYSGLYWGLDPYVVMITKPVATENDQTFHFTYNDYKPGDRRADAITIDKMGQTVTTERGHRGGPSTYYSFKCKSDETQMIVVQATSEIADSNTYMQITPQSDNNIIIAQGNTSASGCTTTDTTYIIRVRNYETQPISFTVTTRPSVAGEAITKPLQAVVGDNTLSGTTTQYYAYKATMTGKLVVTAGEGMSISFPKDTINFNQTHYITQEGNTYNISIEACQTYYIAVSNFAAGSSFGLAERAFEPGEDLSTPYVLTDGDFNLGHKLAKRMWLKYDCDRDGTLTIIADMVEYEWTGNSIMCGTDPDNMDDIAYASFNSDMTAYMTRFNVTKGQTCYFYLQLNEPLPDNNLNVQLTDYVPGVSMEMPEELTSGQAVKLPRTSYFFRHWYRIPVGAGQGTVRVFNNESEVEDPEARIYFATDNLDEGYYDRFYIPWSYEYDSDRNVIASKYTFNAKADGYIFLEIVECNGNDSLVVTAQPVPDGTLAGPYTIVNGVNAKPIAEGQSQAVFKHSATDGTALYIAPGANTACTVSFVRDDGATTAVSGGYISGNTYVYAVPAGQTAYVTATGNDSVSFDAQIETVATAGQGLTSTEPLKFAEGDKFFIGDGINAVQYQYTTYAVYTAAADGVLSLKATNHAFVSVDGAAQSSFSYVSGREYSYQLIVKQGETYSLCFNSSAVVLVTATLTTPEPGSLDMPFEITGDGEYTVPADSGVYYYRYQPSQTGFFSIASDEQLTGGKVLVFNHVRYIQYGEDLAVATSEEDSFDVKCEITTTNYTYYIEITKAQPTSEEQTFTFAYENYQPGETEDNPIVIESLPASLTTATGQDVFYYSYTVPEGVDSLTLSVKATSAVEQEFTDFTIYQPVSIGFVGQGKTEASGIVMGGQTYIIMVNNAEETPLSFEVTGKSVEPGDNIDNPLNAIEGQNDLAANGTKYYKYVATLTGKMIITVSNASMTVAFPVGTGALEGYHEADIDGTTYTINIVEGTTYYIMVSNAIAGEHFTLAERAYAEGETATQAIEIAVGQRTTLKAGTRTMPVWYKVAVGQGTLRFTPDYYPIITWYASLEDALAGNGTELDIQYTYDEAAMETYYSYAMDIEADAVCYFSVSNGSGSNTLLLEGNAAKGLTALTAIDIELNTTTSLPAATSQRPIWCRVTVAEAGLLSVATTAPISASFVMGEDMLMPIEFDENNSFSSPVPAGTYYIIVSNAADGTGITPTFIGQSTAIDTPASAQRPLITTAKGTLSIAASGQLAIHSVSGAAIVSTRIDGSATYSVPAGVYIVRIGNATHKVVVR